MDSFHEQLIARAASIDELLSADFEPLRGQKIHADLAARRLAAWCRSCAGGDWSLFARRLERDRLSLVEVLERFATVRRPACGPPPQWIDDAIWIETALQSPGRPPEPGTARGEDGPYAFEHLLAPLIEAAEMRLWAGVDSCAADNLNQSARASLRLSLLGQVSSLCAAALYERFDQGRKGCTTAADAAAVQPDSGVSQYERFTAQMKAGGFRQLFADKPVLLRLISSLTRQWIETSRELVIRLDDDLAMIRQHLLRSGRRGQVAKIEGGLSDLHNGGRSVQIISFEDGSRVTYKPKDLRADAAWHDLIARLNHADSPIQLKAARILVRDGYGWTEFIEHAGCADPEDFRTFFRRAGAWLALFHCFAASDMHEDNMIAAGDHPVPIDLETILQAVPDMHQVRDPAELAVAAGRDIIASSVAMVGLLPAYGRSPDNGIVAMGGMLPNRKIRTKVVWDHVNSDHMQPRRHMKLDDTACNLPHVSGEYAKFGDFAEDFVSGFEDYAGFLLRKTRDESGREQLFDGFAGLPVRKLTRPTQFYHTLLQRLKDHRAMHDGAAWAAQLDFIARLADWDSDCDPTWPLQQAERAALAQLNVPHFISESDGHLVRDAGGISIHAEVTPGLHRARARVATLDQEDIAWQIEVIRQTASADPKSAGHPAHGGCGRRALPSDAGSRIPRELFFREANKIAEEISGRAIRREPGAAWIGMDWLGDAAIPQLVALGADLYSGSSGIAVFFAAHAAVAKWTPSRELALAAIAAHRKTLKSRTAARFARFLGVGGATGLGSIVYALTLISNCIGETELLADAQLAAELFSDDLVAADRQLDVIGGSAGAILALLSLYRATRSADVLMRAVKCGEHLLAQPRFGSKEGRSWKTQASGGKVINGMSHGAAGFAYALSALFTATGREEFITAAVECIALENSTYDPEHGDWRDPDEASQVGRRCQWCHGAVGIGLARLAMAKHGAVDPGLLANDIRRALDGLERAWPNAVDTLCCGTLGSVELLREAGRALGRPDLRESACRRLAGVVQSSAEQGDYQWSLGKRSFNLGLFRGLAGVGYTLLREVDASLPNVLVWE